MRLYETDPNIISAFTGMGIFLLLSATNGDIANLMSSSARPQPKLPRHRRIGHAAVRRCSIKTTDGGVGRRPYF